MKMANNNTRGAYFTDRKNYVDGLMLALAPIRDFDAIEYARTYTTEEEFVRITDTIGGCAFLDVTALTKAEILKDIARVLLLDELKGVHFPKSIITDIDRKRQIAPLFNS